MCGMILVMDVTTKRCTKCEIRKPKTEFGKVSKTWDGLNSVCKVCWSTLQRARREKNRESDLARKREYRKNNKEKVKAYNKKYQIDNADLFNEYKRKRRALEKDALYLGHTVKDLEARLAYYGGKCWICRTAEHEHWDHVKPLSKGGAHILANLRPSCASCNTSKSDRWPFIPNN